MTTAAKRRAVSLTAVLFGLVLGATPIGDSVNNALTLFGAWLWQQASDV